MFFETSTITFAQTKPAHNTPPFAVLFLAIKWLLPLKLAL
uniref:Uncharacterized protein n=1 Tax=Arundo donax TaxID=35708 RepID=A0A0A9E6E1_ARUDO